MGLIQTLKNIFCPSKKKSAKEFGVIKFFDRKKRFGFIVAGKNEYFFHATSTKPEDFRALKDGVSVSFKVIKGKKGAQADKIELV